MYSDPKEELPVGSTDPSELKEGEDYTLDHQGRFVFTEAYHLKRGYCCQSGCRHCPYGYERKG